jgi:hypothetical protein
MCERTYVACENCGAHVEDGNVLMVELISRTERGHQSLDSDGDPTGDHEWDEDYYDDPQTIESYMECQSCSHTAGDILDHEYSAEDCDCAECEPDIDNFNDPDEMCALVRRLDNGNIPERDEPWPPEIEKLLTNRLIHFIPITRARAAEIADECSGELAIDFDPCVGDPFTVDTSMEITPRAIAQLSIPNEREEVANGAV